MAALKKGKIKFNHESLMKSNESSVWIMNLIYHRRFVALVLDMDCGDLRGPMNGGNHGSRISVWPCERTGVKEDEGVNKEKRK